MSAAVPDVPRRLRPLGVRVAGYVGAGTLVVMGLGVWLAFDASTRAQVTLFERITFGVIVAATAAAGHALTRSRVDVTEQGLVVVNGFKRRELAWNQILAVNLDRGSPWVVMDLSDGTSVSVMAIQASDGARARGQIRMLRRLISEHSG